MRVRPTVLALVGAVTFPALVAGGAAFAQAAPSVPGAEVPGLAPPPPPPPFGRGAPPPPPGAHVIVERGANGLVQVDVKCAERESTQECAGIATQMLDKLGTDAKAR